MTKQIDIFGVPMDLGQSLRGVDMGPSALRIAGIIPALEKLGHKVVDRHDFVIANRGSLEEGEPQAKFVLQIAEFCRHLTNMAYQSCACGAVPLFLGGDHSIAIGTVAGVGRYATKKNQKLGLIWIDAHADMNTPESSPSGNIHGMPLACLLGKGAAPLTKISKEANLDPSKVFLIGIRDLDPKEKALVRSSGVNYFSMSEIDELGMAEVMRRSIQGATDGTIGFHLSFDIDGLDADLAPGVGTPVIGGINFREAHLCMEMIAKSEKLLSMDIVELNPIRDTQNATADLVVHLVGSAFGSRIV